jgi:hypothetical protein
LTSSLILMTKDSQPKPGGSRFVAPAIAWRAPRAATPCPGAVVLTDGLAITADVVNVVHTTDTMGRE